MSGKEFLSHLQYHSGERYAKECRNAISSGLEARYLPSETKQELVQILSELTIDNAYDLLNKVNLIIHYTRLENLSKYNQKLNYNLNTAVVSGIGIWGIAQILGQKCDEDSKYGSLTRWGGYLGLGLSGVGLAGITLLKIR